MEEEAVKELYYRVIATANTFLEGRSWFTIEALKEIDPSVEQLAKTMRLIATVLKDLAGDSYEDTSMALNAFQCCLVMERLADIVGREDDGELEQALNELELHAKVP